MRARDFFESVREAARDAERCNRQLAALEERALAVGRPGCGTRAGTADAGRTERRVAAYVDRERALAERMDGDYRLIDLGCDVLYGRGQDGGGGVCGGLGALHADVLWWRYLACSDWRGVGEAVGYSVRTCQGVHDAALAWADESGLVPDDIG